MYTLNNLNAYTLVTSMHEYNTRGNDNIFILNVRLKKKTQINQKVIGMKI